MIQILQGLIVIISYACFKDLFLPYRTLENLSLSKDAGLF